jgi:hypothetical protein
MSGETRGGDRPAISEVSPPLPMPPALPIRRSLEAALFASVLMLYLAGRDLGLLAGASDPQLDHAVTVIVAVFVLACIWRLYWVLVSAADRSEE